MAKDDSHKEQWYSGDKCRLLSGSSLEHFVHVKLSASVILQVLVKSVGVILIDFIYPKDTRLGAPGNPSSVETYSRFMESQCRPLNQSRSSTVSAAVDVICNGQHPGFPP